MDTQQPPLDRRAAIERAVATATTPIPELALIGDPPIVLSAELMTQTSAAQQVRALQPQADVPDSERMVWLITLEGQWFNPLPPTVTYDHYIFVIDHATGNELYTILTAHD